MQHPQSPIVEKLNHLTAILDDASEGFLTASRYSGNNDLECFFEKLSYQRKDFSLEVKKILQKMGAVTYPKGGFLSLLHRTWKDMSYQLKSRDKDAVKTCCVIGEKFTSNYYESLLANTELPHHLKAVLTSQFQSIQTTLLQFERTQEGTTEGAMSNTISAIPQQTAVSPTAEQKILFLISYLRHIAKDFEMIADELDDKHLKNAFMSLSEENSSFAEELETQAKHYGLKTPDSELSMYWFQAEQENFDPAIPITKDNELMHICDKSEFLFLKLYSDALKEFLSFRVLKDVMVYQYNSIKAGFFKLRMLNSLRYNTDLPQL